MGTFFKMAICNPKDIQPRLKDTQIDLSKILRLTEILYPTLWPNGGSQDFSLANYDKSIITCSYEFEVWDMIPLKVAVLAHFCTCIQESQLKPHF